VDVHPVEDRLGGGHSLTTGTSALPYVHHYLTLGDGRYTTTHHRDVTYTYSRTAGGTDRAGRGTPHHITTAVENGTPHTMPPSLDTGYVRRRYQVTGVPTPDGLLPRPAPSDFAIPFGGLDTPIPGTGRLPFADINAIAVRYPHCQQDGLPVGLDVASSYRPAYPRTVRYSLTFRTTCHYRLHTTAGR